MHASRNQSIQWSQVHHVAALGEPLLELQPVGEEQIRLSIGGDVANSMLCLARLLLGPDPHLSLVTALGSSAYSAWLRKRLERSGLRIIESRISGEPGIYGIPPDRKERVPFSYWRTNSAAHRLLQTAGLPEFSRLIPDADLLVVTGITLALCSPKSFEALVGWMKAHAASCSIVFDVNYRAALWASKTEARRRIAEVEKLASLIATGAEDERSLWTMSGPEAIMERLGHFPVECVLRAGSDGCWVGSASGWDHVPTVPAKVVDPVGAGDAHLAGYIAARLKGGSVLTSARFANSVAATTVAQPGSAPQDDVSFPALPAS